VLSVLTVQRSAYQPADVHIYRRQAILMQDQRTINTVIIRGIMLWGLRTGLANMVM
jgi:hypothetical protein